MATDELRELRQRYRAAYTSYLQCVYTVSDYTVRGEWPPNEVLTTEASTFAELTTHRRALLDALHRHSRKARNSD